MDDARKRLARLARVEDAARAVVVADTDPNDDALDDAVDKLRAALDGKDGG